MGLHLAPSPGARCLSWRPCSSLEPLLPGSLTARPFWEHPGLPNNQDTPVPPPQN